MSRWFTTDADGNIIGLTQEAAQFMNALQGVTFAQTRSGASTERPTSNMAWRYDGLPFLDQTLGKPIFLLSASSNVWIDATGTPV